MATPVISRDRAVKAGALRDCAWGVGLHPLMQLPLLRGLRRRLPDLVGRVVERAAEQINMEPLRTQCSGHYLRAPD